MAEVGVAGAGVMGRGIAQLAAQGGHRVSLFDAKPGVAAKARAEIDAVLGRLAAKGRIEERQRAETVRSIVPVDDLAGLGRSDLVIEAIVERLDAKTAFFAEIEAIVGPDCILATNTSSFLVTAVAERCRTAERLAGLHFFNPVPLMPLVEVIRGARTSERTAGWLVDWVRGVGHQPIEAADTPGFLVNHAGRAYPTEAARIVQEGIAAPHDVDRVMREAAGFRMGPFELLDLTGLDVSFQVMTQLYHDFFEEPRFRPSPLYARQVAAGRYGRKTGAGFYAYPPEGRVEPPEADYRASPPVRRVCLDPEAHNRAECLDLFRRLGIETVQSPACPKDATAVIAPLGRDATTSGAEMGLPLERTVALDSFLPLARRITLMPTLTTDAARVGGLASAIQHAGLAVTVIGDSPGFIAQRMIAAIVNVASEIAQQRIALPEDIDRAIRIGLAYPFGPLEAGTLFGPGTILAILDRMRDFYGDPRYRASAWLRRRAVANLSLLHLESRHE